MICSAKELNMGEDKEGQILELPAEAPVGEDLRNYLQLNDQIMDLAITPNRGDCLSIYGLARETAALFKHKYHLPQPKTIAAKINDTLPIELKAPQQCPRYLGRIIRDLNPHAKTPIWMQERLRRSGLRSIHPVVDVTNYVMIEMGQPLHGFNLENITGGIQVRLAHAGEKLTLLDGKTITLGTDDLVIADHQQALALAGVMGGAASGVTANTQHIFLESAFFSPIPLSLTARRYGLQSDSSYRFARGVDYELPRQAMERATELILEIAGGQPGPVTEATNDPFLPKRASILLRNEQISRLLGIELDNQQVTEILTSLGMKISEQKRGWQVEAPSYRFDINAEIDLIEELGRLYGYQHIPLEHMQVTIQPPKVHSDQLPLSKMLNLMTDRGYFEVITYSFIDGKIQELIDPKHIPILLDNPISNEMNVMRTSLWPGLLQCLQYNQNRQIPRVRIFETGLCFLSSSQQPDQTFHLAGLASGLAYPEQWGTGSRPVDFYDVKGDIEALLALSGKKNDYIWRSGQHPALHPGQSAEIILDNQFAGQLGALHPALIEKLGLTGPVYLFELKLDIINQKQLTEFKAISKFPSVRRDLAVTMSVMTPAEKIEKFILQSAGKLLNSVQIFDVYQGQNVEKGQKSIAFGLNFQDASRTLKDEEIQAVVDNLIKGLEMEFNAKLRV